MVRARNSVRGKAPVDRILGIRLIALVRNCGCCADARVDRTLRRLLGGFQSVAGVDRLCRKRSAR